MKNLSLLNISPIANANNANNNNKPMIQSRSNISPDSFQQKLAHQLNQAPHAENKAKAPSSNQANPNQPKPSEATPAKKTENGENDNNAELAQPVIKKISPLNKKLMELETDKSKILNAQETNEQAENASNLPAGGTPDLSAYITAWIATPNNLQNPAITNDAQMEKPAESDISALAKGKLAHEAGVADSNENVGTYPKVDDLANQASDNTSSDIISNKPAATILKSRDNNQDFENTLASNLTQTATSKDAAPDFAKDLINPASFPGKVESANLQANATVIAQNTISAYPGKEGWDKAINQKIVWMVGANEQTASLTLNPPDLGPLQIVIHVHNEQTDATFSSDNKEVRQALEDGMSNLRDMMKDAGITLGQTNINQHNNQAPADTARFNQQTKQVAHIQQQNIQATPNTIIKTGLGLVDTFA
ncbi:MAG: hypothetical protein HOP04_07265 [Methylophilaceae bacterium]|nr:hypothetical protein [Methylophilaceae bacterium]